MMSTNCVKTHYNLTISTNSYKLLIYKKNNLNQYVRQKVFKIIFLNSGYQLGT